MSSGFSGGASEYFSGAYAGRSQRSYTPQLPEILVDPTSQVLRRLPEFTGKRSLAEFQAHQQQQQALSFYLRNVKARTLQHASPISPLSAPVDFSLCNSPDISSNSSSISSVSTYGFPILRPNNAIPPRNPNFPIFPNPNLLPNRVIKQEIGQESDKKIMNRLQELEKQLLDDEEEGDTVSVVTNSEWSDTFQRLIGIVQPPPVSLSPTSSSSSSSCSSSASPPTLSPKQSIIEAATAISDGKTELATEMLTRLNQSGNVRGTAEQRLTAYFTAALRPRVIHTENPPLMSELYGKDHLLSTQMLYELSPCFKLGFMAANLAILEAPSDQLHPKLHVIDFDIGHGGHYVHLIHALAARKSDSKSLKITAFSEFANDDVERLRSVGDGLRALATKVGVSFNFNVSPLKITDLSLEALGVERGVELAVNLSFRLYKLPDESVTTENLRDELLRRVKGLSPAVVTVVEQEMNTNTAPFVARVNDACGYYGALFDSLDSTISRGNSERLRIEGGLGRNLANSVACEGRDRVERCEVFGKWRARMGMAGFKPKPLSRFISESLRTRLNSGTRGNPGFTVREENGGILFGWMGRTLTVASAWQ